MDYKLAYRNASTNNEWYEMGLYSDRNAAIRAAHNYAKTNMKNSEMGIFAMNEGASYWKNRRPIMLINRQGDDRLIPASIGGIINNNYKPGNNVR